MSLLEDVFLQDEANEAQELERIIEGDEFEERARSRSDSDDNSEREDEAEEEKKRVEPASTKARRVIKNPRFILNPARLNGPKGIQVIPEHFQDFKFKGKGCEKEDLDLVLKKLEHWAYRLYPKFKFEDCLKKIETLGKKRPVMVHLHKIRTDQYLSEETVVQKDSSGDEAHLEEELPEDEFDKLLQQQIELARSTPAPSSVKKGMDTSEKEKRSLIMSRVTSSPSISDEQRERILKSRKLAEERRVARLKSASNTNFNTSRNITENLISHKQSHISNISSKNNNNHKNILGIITENVIEVQDDEQEVVRKVSRTNIIDSSDEEDCVSFNESVIADVHNTGKDKGGDNGKDHKNGTEKSVHSDNVHVDLRDDNDNEKPDMDVSEDFDRDNRLTGVNEKQSDNREILEKVGHSNNDKETDDLTILDLDDKLSHHGTTKNDDLDMKSNNESSKANEIHCNDSTEVEQKFVSDDIPVEKSSDKPVENNDEDLMDIDFSDDF